MPRGGARPNSGPKPGSQHKATLTKIEAREAIRQSIGRHADQLVEAQIANAQGLKYLVTRDKRSGKFIRVTEAMAKAKQAKVGTEDEEIIEVWEKDPSVQAFTDLLNRYLDKPKEQEQEVAVTGKLVVEIVRAW